MLRWSLVTMVEIDGADLDRIWHICLGNKRLCDEKNAHMKGLAKTVNIYNTPRTSLFFRNPCPSPSCSDGIAGLIHSSVPDALFADSLSTAPLPAVQSLVPPVSLVV